MENVQWRCVTAMVVGLSIEVLVAALSVASCLLPSLTAGLGMGLFMAVSESAVDIA